MYYYNIESEKIDEMHCKRGNGSVWAVKKSGLLTVLRTLRSMSKRKK